MKKLTLIFTLILALALTCTQANDDFSQYEDRDSKKRVFFGFSAGVGAMDLGALAANPRIFSNYAKDLEGNSLSYAFALEGGWQRYTTTKTGYRAMFRGKIAIASDFKHPIFSAPKAHYKSVISFDLSSGIDGFFDFVKNGKTGFGMIVGGNIGMAITGANTQGQYAKTAIGFTSHIRTGFYVQIPSGFFDLVLEAPIMPILLIPNPYNYTLTLGYKHFF